MINDLHFKYAAIFGLLPYVKPMKPQQQQQPMAFEHHQQNSQYHYQHYNNRPLRWQQIYTVTLIVANLITTLHGVIFLSFGDTFIVSNFVSILVFVVQMIVVISILLETMLTYEKYYKLMRNFKRVQMSSQQLLQIQLCKEDILRRQCRKYSFYLLTVYGSLFATVTSISIHYYYGYFWHSLFAILIARTRSMQMLFYMDYIIYYMELLNWKLKALLSCKIHKNYQLLDIDYAYLESFDYIYNMKHVYHEIYYLHNTFNDLYGLSLASVFTVVVFDIIINMYWSFLTALNVYEPHVNYVTISTIVPLFVIVFMLCYAGEQCEKQCNLMLVSLKCLLKTSHSSVKAKSYNSLLQKFIMQITQNPIIITANDYFSINLQFLMKIFVNIVTHLLILLQFSKKSSINEESVTQS